MNPNAKYPFYKEDFVSLFGESPDLTRLSKKHRYIVRKFYGLPNKKPISPYNMCNIFQCSPEILDSILERAISKIPFNIDKKPKYTDT